MVCFHLKLIVAIMLRILLIGRGGVSKTSYYYNSSRHRKMEVTWTRMVILKVVKSMTILFILKIELTELLRSWMWSVKEKGEMLKSPENRIAVDFNGEDLERVKEFSPDMLSWLSLLLIMVRFITLYLSESIK